MPSRLQLQEEWAWVSAKVVAARSVADGVRAVYSQFPNQRRRLIEYLSVAVPAAAADGREPECLVVQHPISDYPPGYKGASSLAEWVSNAHALFEGTITGIQGGFFGTSPAILVRVEVQEWLKRDPATYPTAHQVMYFLYPAGVFPLGRGSICVVNASDWPGLPEIGSRVLLASQRFARGREANVVIPLGIEIALEHGKRLAVPGALRKVFGASDLHRFEQLLRQARRLAEGGAR